MRLAWTIGEGGGWWGQPKGKRMRKRKDIVTPKGHLIRQSQAPCLLIGCQVDTLCRFEERVPPRDTMQDKVPECGGMGCLCTFYKSIFSKNNFSGLKSEPSGAGGGRGRR